MLKLMVIVLCHFLLYYVSRVVSVPVIKASGVQWSEPRGSGKGNITLIMIPQNNSCGNDSDVIVAVKSEYQILSQDTQLLNLVVNEETNTTDSGNSTHAHAHTHSCTTSEPLDAGDELKSPNTASYFQPAKKQSLDAVSNNSVNVNGKQINPVRESASTVNIFKLLNLVDLNEKKSYSFEATQIPSTASIHNLFKFLNVPIRTVFNQNTAKSIAEGKSEPDPIEIDSKDPFYNEALNVMDKLKQDPTYYESIAVKPNPANTSDAGRGRAVNYDSKGGDMDLALEGEDAASDVGNEKPKVEEIDPVIAACLSSTISNDQSSIGINQQSSSVAPSTGESAATSRIELSTSADSNQTFTPEIAGIFPATAGSSSVSYAVEVVPFGGREQVLTTEICTTIISRCGPSTTEEPGVFHQIVDMLNGTNNETTPSAASTLESIATDMTAATSGVIVSKSVEVESTVVAADVMNAGAVGRTESAISCNVSSTISKPEKLPRKITLEPRLNCDNLLKMNTLSVSTEPTVGDLEPQLRELSPFLESVVFLANKNEMSRGKDIPLFLNTSSDEFSLTDLQDKSEKMHGKAAELYNSDPLVLDYNHHRQIKPIELSPAEPSPVKSNGKRRISIRNKSRDKGKVINPDLNRILKVQFAGQNLVLKQKPSYKYEMNDKHCDSTEKVKNDLPHSGLEPSDEEENESNTEAKTEFLVVKTQSTSITQDVSNDHNEQNEKIKTTPRSHSDEDRGVKKTFNGNKTTKKPTSNESQQNYEGVDKIDTLNEKKHKTTDRSTDYEETLQTEDKPGIGMQSSTTMDNDRRTKQNSDSAKISSSEFNVPQTYELKESTSHCESLYETTTQRIVTEEVTKETEFGVTATTSTTSRTSTTSSTTQQYDYHKDSEETTSRTSSTTQQDDYHKDSEETTSRTSSTTQQDDYHKDSEETTSRTSSTTQQYNYHKDSEETTSRTSSTTQQYDYHKDSEEDEEKTEEISEQGKGAAKKDKNQLTANGEQTMYPVGDRTRRTTEGRCQTKSCGQNINIPANSVKEIVIKIIRTTREPTKIGKTYSNMRHNIEREQNGFRPVFAKPPESRESYHGYKDNLQSSNIKHQLELPEMTYLDAEAPQSPTSASARILEGTDEGHAQFLIQKASPFMNRNYGFSKQLNFQQNLQNRAPMRELYPVVNNQKSEDPFLAGTRASPEHRYPPEQAKSSMCKPNIIHDLSNPANKIVDRNGKSLGSNILKLLLNDKSVIKTE